MDIGLRIEEVLASADLSWFTVMLKGEQLRYVVGLTNNKERSVNLLVEQYYFYAQVYDSVSIGWRTDHHTGEVYIDIGTTTDDRLQAHLLKKLHNQQCFRDMEKSEDIY